MLVTDTWGLRALELSTFVAFGSQIITAALIHGTNAFLTGERMEKETQIRTRACNVNVTFEFYKFTFEHDGQTDG